MPMKRILKMSVVTTVIACGCICLMVATSGSADFLGVKTVNKDDPDIDLLQVNPLVLDIRPGKCPNRLRQHSLGFLKVALIGTSACQVRIDSLQLVNENGCGTAVAPLKKQKCADRATPFLGELCDCHKLGADGINDWNMKFKLSDVRVALCLEQLPSGTISTLCLTGNTNEGTPINACDCVILTR